MDQWPNKNRDQAIIYGDNENKSSINAHLLWGAAKSVLRHKCRAIQVYLKKEEQSQMNSLNSQLIKLEKEEQMRPKDSRNRNITKIREEVNKVEKNNTIEKKQWNQELVLWENKQNR